MNRQKDKKDKCEQQSASEMINKAKKDYIEKIPNKQESKQSTLFNDKAKTKQEEVQN